VLIGDPAKFRGCGLGTPVYPATMFNNADHRVDLYGDSIEVDYRGYEVTVENFVRILTGMSLFLWLRRNG